MFSSNDDEVVELGGGVRYGVVELLLLLGDFRMYHGEAAQESRVSPNPYLLLLIVGVRYMISYGVYIVLRSSYIC
jgi:hypothetical protein